MASRRSRDRVLTEILKTTGDKEITLADGTVTTYAKRTAELLWTMATKGQVEFDDGRKLKTGAREWNSTVSFIYNQIDGPAKVEQDINISTLEKELSSKSEEELREMAKEMLGDFDFNIDTILQS